MWIAVLILLLAGYAGLHYYLYRKVTRAFPSHPARFGFGILLGILVAAPLACRLLDLGGFSILSRLINLPVFIWMAWVFWFFIGGVVLDAWNLGLRRLPRFTRLRVAPRLFLAILGVAIALATAWSAWEGSRPVVRTVVIHHPALPARTPVRLVQVSDVHLGLLRSEAWNRSVCGIVAALAPDLVVSTGDMLDATMQSIGHQAEAWAALAPPLGKYAVLGNHEFYLGLADSLEFLRRAGFRVLRQETVVAGNALVIGGIDDREGVRLQQPCLDNENGLVTDLAGNRFSILLKHRPVPPAGGANGFNLQLSGHTHNGQLFPFHALVRLSHRYLHGLYPAGPGFQLYVNAGTGTWGPPLRLLAPPEITLFILQR